MYKWMSDALGGMASYLVGVAAGLLLCGSCLVYAKWGGWAIAAPILIAFFLIGASSAWMGRWKSGQTRWESGDLAVSRSWRL